MQQKEGFPNLNTPLKIYNKLNNMALTISEGWHGIKADSVIIQKPIFTQKQKFKITDKDHMKVYYIEASHKDLVLSTKSSWSDMVYSQVRMEKNDKDTNQLWRIVAYEDVVYSENQQSNKSLFQYEQLTQAVVEPIQTKIMTQSSSQQNPLGLGYPETEIVKPSSIQQTKVSQISTAIYNLGYQFDSGPTVQTFVEVKTAVTATNSSQQPQQFSQPQYNIANPPRFPIKQKNNLPPIDLNNKGWFFIENVKFNLVLEIEGGIDEPGMSIVLNKLNGNRNQLWRFE